MELAKAVWNLEEGYCLWIGAGLTRQVAAGRAAVPLWDELTLELESAAKESAAGIEIDESSDFPNRLDKCMTVLGESAFCQFIRERYYTSLCEALLLQADTLNDSKDLLPDSVRAVAALGQLANPIVSFNVEPLSSLLLGRPGGPVRVLFQQAPGKPSYTWREPGGRFQRLVYHPHGLATADTVMTATQYEANSQTLAFGMAIHAAFGNTLAIVGMSLDDKYLRHQIERFRPNIGAVYWFNSQFPDETLSWTSEHGITTVQAEWSDFWQQWHTLPIDLNQEELIAAWYLAVYEAVEEAEGGSLGSLERSLRGLPAAAQSLGKLAAYLSQAGTQSGEPGKARLIGGKEPRAIELALRERVMKLGIPVPIISKRLDPRVERRAGV